MATESDDEASPELTQAITLFAYTALAVYRSDDPSDLLEALEEAACELEDELELAGLALVVSDPSELPS